jgi:nitronate monooxygenase
MACGLRLPLIAAPMLRVSGPALVSAACRNGVIGAFPTLNARSPEELDLWLTAIEEDCERHEGPTAPVCPNVIMRRDPLALKADIEILVKHQVKMVIASVGSPETLIKPLHYIGCKVFADVASVRHAEKAIEVGADGLILLSSGAGGQTGWANGLSFARALRRFYDGLLVLSGGISDGHALWAARVLGCDFGMMGTRFIATHESLAQPAHKEMVVASRLDDVVLTQAITGLNANFLRPSLLKAGLDANEWAKPISPEEARERFGSGVSPLREGSRRWTDIWSAGHTVSAVDDVRSAADLIDEISSEYLQAQQATATMLASQTEVAPLV